MEDIVKPRPATGNVAQISGSMAARAETIETRIGQLDFELGVPTRETVTKLYDEIDFQRACQLYLWALPAVSFAQMGVIGEFASAAHNCDVVISEGYRSVSAILTANVMTPYISGIMKNADGSVDLYFAPAAPKGFEKNWIPTVPGKAWFVYFRLYAPLESYFDKSWLLPDIERMQ